MPPRCPRCTADLSHVASAARFCPSCGTRLAEFWRTFSTNPTDDRIDVVRGYAAAMFRLGVHYESRHNELEAERCFDKASRLGHANAGVRREDLARRSIPFARLA